MLDFNRTVLGKMFSDNFQNCHFRIEPSSLTLEQKQVIRVACQGTRSSALNQGLCFFAPPLFFFLLNLSSTSLVSVTEISQQKWFNGIIGMMLISCRRLQEAAGNANCRVSTLNYSIIQIAADVWGNQHSAPMKRHALEELQWIYSSIYQNISNV